MDKLARIRRQAVSTDDTIPAVSSPRAQRRQRWLPALITAAQQRLFGQDDAATPRHRASTPFDSTRYSTRRTC